MKKLATNSTNYLILILEKLVKIREIRGEKNNIHTICGKNQK